MDITFSAPRADFGDRPTIAIVGCGPTALFFLKQLLDRRCTDYALTFFSDTARLGVGMPYDPNWVGLDNLANIACEEIPDLDMPAHEWFQSQSDGWLAQHGLESAPIGPHLIPTRNQLGLYLEAQFDSLLKKLRSLGVPVQCLTRTRVCDIKPGLQQTFFLSVVTEATDGETTIPFDHVVIATGHQWQPQGDGTSRYMSSPWPIATLETREARRVGLLGSSLSAVDACLTLARKHGRFERGFDGDLTYVAADPQAPLSVTMYSRRGLLPDLRFHFENPHFELHQYVTRATLMEHIEGNGGFLSLDFIFDMVIKYVIRLKAPKLYELVTDSTVESFTAFVQARRSHADPFMRLNHDYSIALTSVRNREPIFWREILDDIAYTLNFYVRYLSPEDVIRLREHLMPLVTHLVAVLPHTSCEQLLALHAAGCLDERGIGHAFEINTIEDEQTIFLTYTRPDTGLRGTAGYDLIVDCRGQKPVNIEEFPFPSLVETGLVTPAVIRSPAEGDRMETSVTVGGIAVDEDFHPLGADGRATPEIHVLAAPMISGLYPYHSGFPFCNEIARIAVNHLATRKTAKRTPKKGVLATAAGPADSTGALLSKTAPGPDDTGSLTGPHSQVA